jgi:hypothetical protein
MAAKHERRNGFFQGLNFASRMNEVAFLSMVQKTIDSGEYKKEYDTVKEFIQEVTGVTYNTFKARMEAVQAFGPEMTNMLVGLDLHWRDIRMIESMMSDDQKANMKKGVLEIGDRKIPINEAHAEDVRIAFENMKESATLARKAEKTAEGKAAAADGKWGKELKAREKKIADLEAQLISPESPDAFAELWQVMESRITEIAIICSKLDFEKAHAGIPDGPVKAKYEPKISGAEAQFSSLVQKMRDAVYGKE